MKKTILVTGAAGFIGFHICKKIFDEDYDLIGIDNLNSYYDVNLKKQRINLLNKNSSKSDNSWQFKKIDIENYEALESIFQEYNPSIVINLAAQAGVRHSIQNPKLYVSTNMLGFSNLLECCRTYDVKNFIYASSSSVYGGNKKIPFSENDSVDHPISLYAASKRANELMAFSYSHLYKIPSIGLRLFTVYGPWGRPDMAPMIFSDAIVNQKTLNIFNNGDMARDFTFIDDVVEIIIRLIEKPIKKSFLKNGLSTKNSAPHKIFNVGKSEPIQLMNFINLLEDEFQIKARKNFLEMQAGDVEVTFAETKEIESYTGFKPKVNIKEGIKKFATWYKNHYQSTSKEY